MTGSVEKGIESLIALASVGATAWSWTGSTGGSSVLGTIRCEITTLGGLWTSTRGVVATISAGIAIASSAIAPSSSRLAGGVSSRKVLRAEVATRAAPQAADRARERGDAASGLGDTELLHGRRGSSP